MIALSKIREFRTENQVLLDQIDENAAKVSHPTQDFFDVQHSMMNKVLKGEINHD